MKALMTGQGPTGAAVPLKVSAEGGQTLGTLLAGELQQVNRLAGGAILPAVKVTASSTVATGPCVYGGVLCLTAGTITLYDNTAASGDAYLTTVAMAAGEFLMFGNGAQKEKGNGAQVLTNTGLYATIAGGSFLVLAAN